MSEIQGPLGLLAIASRFLDFTVAWVCMVGFRIFKNKQTKSIINFEHFGLPAVQWLLG
jgi:hypothetical protein